MSLTPEKAEILGALMGDKTRFGFYKRYGRARGTKPRGILEISVGWNLSWGTHLSDLAYRAYGLRGSILVLKNPPPRRPELRFRMDSSRVVTDLALYYDPRWDWKTWRVPLPIFDSPVEVIRGLLRGYMDADGYVHTSPARAVRADSVNEEGLSDIQRPFAKLSIRGRMYAMRFRKSWILQITRRENISKYQELVGFSITHKANALSRIISAYKQPP